jgi:hypothetical protein
MLERELEEALNEERASDALEAPEEEEEDMEMSQDVEMTVGTDGQCSSRHQTHFLH